MLEIKNISKTFNKDTANAVEVLHGISLQIPANSFTVITGSNGSGKSTLLNVLSGAVRPDEGQVLFDGMDVTRLKDYQRSRWVACMFQNPLMGTSPDLTVLENFRLASLRTRPKGLRIGTGMQFKRLVSERISDLGIGLELKVDQPMSSLSGGQRQALTLLMATMPAAGDDDVNGSLKILLLDEPTASLDPKTSALILQGANRVIREFGLTVLLVTHHLKDALNYGDRILHLKNGVLEKDLSGEAKSRLTLAELAGWFE